MNSDKKIAIFAGAGDLPLIAAQICQSNFFPYVMVGFHGQTPTKMINDHPHFWTYLGTVAHTLEQLKNHNIKNIIFAGAIKRPSFVNLKVDYIGAQWLSQLVLKPRGDDQLLTFLSQKLQEHGYPVINLNHLKNNLSMPLGVLTKCAPCENALKDIKLGQHILNHMGVLDIGQAIVIQQQIVLGIEAIEGTDDLIRRTSLLKRPGPLPILVKISKPQQDLRFDQPTIGPLTIELLKKHDFQGIALQAYNCLILNRSDVIKLCDTNNLFLTGIL